MRNFLKIAEGVDVMPLLHAVMRQPELWNKHTVRTYHEQSAHRVVDDIILRYSKFDKGDDFFDKVCSEIQCVNYPALNSLPEAKHLIFLLMARVEGEQLGRAMISRVAPGIAIPPHDDRIRQAESVFPDKIRPAEFYDRYHIVLKSSPGTIFRCGDEQVYMATGEVWWFNNLIEHEVLNNSVDDRIHLVVDIRTYKNDYIPA